IHKALSNDNNLNNDKRSSNINRVNCIISYHQNNPNLKTIFKNNFSLISYNECLSQIFNELPRITYTRPTHIKDTLVNSSLHKPLRVFKGSFKTDNCTTCKQMENTLTISATANPQFIFSIKGSFTCKSTNIVFLFQCSICGIQYIGETKRSFRQR